MRPIGRGAGDHQPGRRRTVAWLAHRGQVWKLVAMRIIAGTFRGRSLTAPPGRTTRPITDRVKETLFNILGHRLGLPGELPALTVLDVFAGPGSLGLEALSRGARRCTFVERDRAALRSLRQNIHTLGVEHACTIWADNAWTLHWPHAPQGIDLAFVDPPYRDGNDPQRLADLLQRMTASLAPEALVVCRQENAAPALEPGLLRGVGVVDQRVIGRMRLVFLASLPADPDPRTPVT